jgi:hypothetical protein
MDITGCSLTELVDDPLIDLVMKSDRVDRNELELLLQRVARERLRAKQLACISHGCLKIGRSEVSCSLGVHIGNLGGAERTQLPTAVQRHSTTTL